MGNDKDSAAPPPGPPPGRTPDGRHVHFGGQASSEQASRNPFRLAHPSNSQGPPQSSPDLPPAYEMPAGPPPNWHNEEKRDSRNQGIAPPLGPPPSLQPANDPEPPPYDPWLAVPDNTLLPPPPSLKQERSPTANATLDQAQRGHDWCRANRLWPPGKHSPQTLQRIVVGSTNLTKPPNTKNVNLNNIGLGRTHIRTSPKCEDTLFLTDIPFYTAFPHSLPRKIYYELKILQMGSPPNHNGETDAGVALGFLAPPYPSWRLPGWHRASLAVHGDDGRRYVDDSFGGREFTHAFRKGDTVGVGMRFSPSVYAGGKDRVEVFFTRNGKVQGGWNVHEERDREAEEGDVFGLEGGHDLLGAVGCFGGVEFEARFRQGDWMYRGD
ncbi:hypothetical protein LTR62_007134 [Meristemomyces frigidus]|uniref:SPRY domain-containing protein n=1 Tax=Meristemomyces frigidus TaxID=1508187 RepID=A0AAN7TMQ8_9PEZI|nr:hypothetical protein LTR62_007134 [Meristemomyces frigidus]